jgi:O-antigen/teichoic acid export membrane protein
LIIIGVLSCPTAYLSEYFIASGKTLLGSLCYLVFDIIKVAGLIFYAYYYDLETLFNFYFYYNIICFLLSTIIGIRIGIIGLSFDKNDFKKAMTYAMPLSFSACVFYFIDRIDHLFLIEFFSTQEYAFYAVGCLVFPPIIILESSFQKYLIPKMTNLFNTKHFEKVESVLAWYIERISSFVIPISLFSFWFAKDIISFLYGKNYIEATYFLQLFSITYLFPIIPYDSIQRSTNKTKSIFKKSLFILSLYLLLLFCFGTHMSKVEILTLSILMKLIYRLFIFHGGMKEIRLFKVIPAKIILLFIIHSLSSLFFVTQIENYLSDSIIVLGASYCLLYAGLVLATTRSIRLSSKDH